MPTTIPTDLLLRLVQATPEQQAAIYRYLGGSAEGGDDRAATPLAAPGTRYGLRMELGNWTVQMNGGAGVIRQGRAMQLVEYLVKHPPAEAIHATEWENRVDGGPLLDGFGGIGRADSDDRPAVEVGEVGGVVQEGTGRKFVGRISLPALKAELAELRAASQDMSSPAEERAAAQKRLTGLLRAHGRGGKLVGETGRAVDRVRKQIRALIAHLKAMEVTKGQPHVVLRAFGRHLEDFLWLPSMGGRKRLGAATKPGCFTYDPPDGVVWGN